MEHFFCDTKIIDAAQGSEIQTFYGTKIIDTARIKLKNGVVYSEELKAKIAKLYDIRHKYSSVFANLIFALYLMTSREANYFRIPKILNKPKTPVRDAIYISDTFEDVLDESDGLSLKNCLHNADVDYSVQYLDDKNCRGGTELFVYVSFESVKKLVDYIISLKPRFQHKHKENPSLNTNNLIPLDFEGNGLAYGAEILQPTDAELKNVLSAVNSMTYDERGELALKINQLDLRKIFTADNQERGFICPLCGNGSGNSGDGITPSLTTDDNGNEYFIHHCFKCGNFEGTLTAIIANFNGLKSFDAKTLAIGKHILALAESSSYTPPPIEHREELTPDKKEKLLEMIKADIVDAQKNLDKFPLEDRRGLTIETLKHFGAGYSANWVLPKFRMEGKHLYHSKRLIVPTSDSTYNAILLKSARTGDKDERKSLNAGEKKIFNVNAIIKDKPVIIVEGEIDAMSIWQATDGNVNIIALGGAGQSNLTKFLQATIPATERKNYSFVVLFDNDSTGKEQSDKLIENLLKIGCPAVSKFLDNGDVKVDANDILINEGDAALNSRVEQIISATQIELDACHAEQDIGDELKRLKALPQSKDRDEQIIAEINNRLYLTPQRKRAHMQWIADSLQENAKLIFENDPSLDGLVGYDEFYRQYTFLKPVFWRKGNCTGEQWKDADDKELARYLRDTYQNFKGAELIDINLTHYAGKNSFHPVKQYLESLHWDGVPRAETYFSKFLNADDTPYTREITLKWLLGAIARIYHEGCDFQFALVLHGRQGVGKGYCLRMLGKQWHVALMDSLDDSHAVDTIERGWIVEIAELAAGRKAELNAQKAFLSANEDTRRRAYARRADTVKRHCVFAISVNDEHFLKDLTGNRRYKILESHSAQNEIVEGLTVEYVNQVWAEVFHIYQELFKDKFDDQLLRLSRDVDLQADEIAEKHLQDDGLQGEIESFLDKPILPDFIWRWLNKDERRKFFVDEHIKFDEHELNYRIRANIKSKNKAQEMINQIDSYLRDANNNVYTDTVQVLIAGQKSMRKQYTLYGNTTRNETCAAEIFNECFGNDKRKSTNRINEILSNLADWKRVDKHIRNFSAVYGQQNISYWRGFLAINQ